MDVSLAEVQGLVNRCIEQLNPLPSTMSLVGIPRGGITVAALLSAAMPSVPVRIFSSAERGSLFPISPPAYLVDDVVATGETIQRALVGHDGEYRGIIVLVDKRKIAPETIHGLQTDQWVTFPWERSEPSGPEDAVRRLIEWAGDDPARPGLLDTPRRVLRFLEEIREQGKEEVSPTTFESEVEDLIVTAGIPFASLCEHHMLPYWGEASVGYVPHGKLLGLSKAARAVYTCAAGLTVQEHLTHRVAQYITEWTGSQDVAVVTTAVHSCMTVRGARAIGARTSASAMYGRFRESPAIRAEFFAVVEGAKQWS